MAEVTGGRAVAVPDLDASAFDRAAADFSRLAPLLRDPVGAATVTVSRPAPGERVLDACCGDGAAAVLAAEAAGPVGEVDAVDLSAGMVALARRRAGRHGNLRLHRADVTTWSRSGYDLVQCVLGVFFLPDMDRGSEVLVGRARPGGRVAVTSWRAGAMVPAGRALVAAVAAERGSAVPTPVASARLQEVQEPEAFRRWLTSRGLVDVEVATAVHEVPSTAEALWLLVLGSGFRGLLDGLDEPAAARVRAGYLGALAGGPAVDASTLVGLGRRHAAR